MIHIGTRGFSCEDWVGLFYPEELAKQNWLAFYVQELDPLAEGVRELEGQVGTVYAFANNHWKGQAVDSARQLRLLLEGVALSA